MPVFVDFENQLTQHWDERIHQTGQPVPANCEIWGLKILDWDNSFSERMERFTEADLKIPFQYIDKIPDWNKGAVWNDQTDIMGRFEPPSIYSNSGPQEISFEMIYNAEALKNSPGIRTHWTLENIEQYVKRMQSLVYPQYDGRYSPPTKVLFNIGNIYRNVPLVIKNVQVAYEAPFDISTGLARNIKISVQSKVDYPMYQGIGQMTVYTAWDNARGVGQKYGGEVFAYEVLDSKYNPASGASNPWQSAFAKYT